jgi:hypothetical protein
MAANCIAPIEAAADDILAREVVPDDLPGARELPSRADQERNSRIETVPCPLLQTYT